MRLKIRAFLKREVDLAFLSLKGGFSEVSEGAFHFQLISVVLK